MKLTMTKFTVKGDIIEVTAYRGAMGGRHAPVGKIVIARKGARETLNTEASQSALRKPVKGS